MSVLISPPPKHHQGARPRPANCGRALPCLIFCASLLAVPGLSQAQEAPGWAVFTPDKNTPAPPSVTAPDQVQTLPGSDKKYTNAQIDDIYNPPDWFPAEHAPMPALVAHGDKARGIMACASCHLASGTGHPESAYLAGRSAPYFLQQLKDFNDGTRHAKDEHSAAAFMARLSKQMSPQEMQAAADWFAHLTPIKWYEVEETAQVPKSFVNATLARRAYENGETEPLGQRIVELPQDVQRVEARDPHAGFVAYVPKGSLEKGRTLVETGDGKTVPCASCHGAGLRRPISADIPPIAGIGPTYIVRQLYAFKNGERQGPQAQTMKAIVAGLSADDMLAIAAYVSSLDPATP